MRYRSRAASALAAILLALALAACAVAQPEPTPTPTPTPAPTPTPRPAAYEIAYEGIQLGEAADGLVEAEIRLSVTNTGGSDGVDIPVSLTIGDAPPVDFAPIPALAAGDAVSLKLDHSLAPGDHAAVFRVADREHSEALSVLAADLTLAIDGYALVADGVVDVEARVVNGGNMDAEAVVVRAVWSPQPGAEGTPGVDQRAALIDLAPAGGEEAVNLSLPIPSGAYDLALTVTTPSREADVDDNAAQHALLVEYSPLTVTVEAVEVIGYTTEGDGVVELQLTVVNEGVAATGPLAIGAACAPDAPEDCGAVEVVDSLRPGDEASHNLSFTVPQGEQALTVYAGASEQGYRWGDANALPHLVAVPEKSAIDLSLATDAEVTGYWADGTVGVNFEVTVRNDGYQPIADALTLSIACLDGDASAPGCGGPQAVTLPDGFGPTTATVALTAPMGATVSAALPEAELEAEAVTVAERILGVDREVWACYSDRPEWEATYANDWLAGCGGWTEDVVVKWSPGLPVRVWADPTGEQRYVDILRESLDELAPVLGLEVEWVADESDANLKAYVGVPSGRNASAGFSDYCKDAAGCGGPRRVTRGSISSSRLSVWLDPDDDRREIKHITIHEILHAVTGVHHSPSPLSKVCAGCALSLDRFSSHDDGIYAIQGHPLVKPGMTMEEVGELIVFSDELLDPPAEAALEDLAFAEDAYVALIEAESASFRVQGNWGSSHGCNRNRYNGRLSVGDMSRGFAGLRHFEGAQAVFASAYVEDEGWSLQRWQSNRWVETMWNDLDNATHVRIGFTEPLDMLISVLRYADPDGISVTSDGTSIRLTTELENARALPISWASGATINVEMTLNAETMLLTDYSMGWWFATKSGSSCTTYSVTASDAEYGGEIPDPR